MQPLSSPHLHNITVTLNAPDDSPMVFQDLTIGQAYRTLDTRTMEPEGHVAIKVSPTHSAPLALVGGTSVGRHILVEPSLDCPVQLVSLKVEVTPC